MDATVAASTDEPSTRKPVTLAILFADDDIIIVDKPRGMKVHANDGTEERDEVAMKVLKAQLGGQHVGVCHRLDRPTSGVLVFSKGSKHITSAVGRAFQLGHVRKQYLAVVRGVMRDAIECTAPLPREGGVGVPQDCVTLLTPLGTGALADDVRVTLVCCAPRTGRYHQVSGGRDRA